MMKGKIPLYLPFGKMGIAWSLYKNRAYKSPSIMPDQTFMNEKRLFSKGRRQRTYFDGGGGLWERSSLSIYLPIF